MLAEMELKLAKLWQQKGKLERAIAGYRRVLALEPGSAEVHKQHIDLMVEMSGLEAAFKHYGLSDNPHCLKGSPVQTSAADTVCCSVVRNEALRLPYFLSYYRSKGVSKFFIVDNGSTDGSLSLLRTEPDVFVWRTDFPFHLANFGSVWFELLLRRYAVGCWCVIADADELFYYPDCEDKSILQLCDELDQRGEMVYLAILLDMYSDRAIAHTTYEAGQDFRTVCPYFDRTFYHRAYENSTPYQNQTIYAGGLRERIFGPTGDYYLSKVPLLKYSKDCVLAGGQHWTSYPTDRIAKGRGAVLHFKYFAGFSDYVSQETNRKEHYGEAFQYRQYAQTLSEQPTLKLYSQEHSVKLVSSEQLVERGIMQRNTKAALWQSPRKSDES